MINHINVEGALEQMLDTTPVQAQHLLHDHFTQWRFRDWFSKLDLPNEATLETDPNNYFQTHQLGLMSHNIRAMLDGREILPRLSTQSPTLGIICNTLLPEGELAVVEFQPNKGEIVTGFSRDGVLMGHNTITKLNARESFRVDNPDKVVVITKSTRPEDLRIKITHALNGVYGCTFV